MFTIHEEVLPPFGAAAALAIAASLLQTLCS